MNKPLLVILAGPTAVGKTSVAIELATHYGSEIISCDSRQIYKELGVAVAKPSPSELNAIPHHFIDHVSIQDEYNAGIYEKECNALLKELFMKHRILFMVGGTGLYIQAAIDGLDNLPKANKDLRLELNRILNSKGIMGLQKRLLSSDPNANLADLKNPQRLIRAIEIVESSGKPLSDSLHKKDGDRDYQTLRIYLTTDRGTLYSRINARVDQMISQGMEQEARELYPHRHLAALQTVGYSEWFNFFDGKYSREFAIDKIKQHSRNYAKRQITWFKNKGFKAFGADSQSIIKAIEEKLQNL